MPSGWVCKRGLALTATVLLGGCSSARTYHPLTVAVRDRQTHEPVPAALVRARTVHFFVPDPFMAPFEPYPILDGSPPASTHGRSDERGHARFDVIVDHPVQMTVTAVGYEPLVVYLPQHSHTSINQSIGDPGDPTTEAVLTFLGNAKCEGRE